MISRRKLAGVMAAALPSAASPAKDPSFYPLFRAKGSHRELGRQHGEQAGEYIKKHLDSMCAGQKLSREKLRLRALRFQPMFEQHCPHLLGEMRGLAEGARPHDDGRGDGLVVRDGRGGHASLVASAVLVGNATVRWVDIE